MSARLGEWDAVVIGAGLGGLTCAAYLAVGGMKVLVLEQSQVVGGNTHVFRRYRKYEFDVGVHYVGDCGPGGLIPAILDGLGLSGRVTFRSLDPRGFDRVVAGDISVDVPASWAQYRLRVSEALPHDATGIEHFTRICSTVAAQQRSFLLAEASGEGAHPPIAPALPGAWDNRTLDELFVHCGLSRRARTVLAAQSPNYGQSPRQAAVGTHAAMIDHYLRGAYYPRGGGQMLSASLLETITSHRGEVRTRHRVRRVLVENGTARGVALANGDIIRAPVVVSNADYRRTVLELVGPWHFHPRIVRRTERTVMSLPWIVLYIAVDRELRDQPNANLWWYRTDDIDGYYDELMTDDVPDEVPFFFVSFSSLKDPGNRLLCPPGQTNFQVMTLSPPGHRPWGVEGGPADGTRYRRSSRYRAEKQRRTTSLLRAAENVLGPFRSHIVHLEAATPLTQERYTRSTGGTPYGMAEWGASGTARPDVVTGIDGLYVVGTSSRYGTGVCGVMVGGVVCADRILGRPLLAEVCRGAVLATNPPPARPPRWNPLDFCREQTSGNRLAASRAEHVLEQRGAGC